MTAFSAQPPHPTLKAFIHYYWEVRGTPASGGERFLPGLSPAFIVSKRTERSPLRYRGNTELQPLAFVKGILSEHALLEEQHEVWNIGVAFRPGAARPLLDRPADAWRETVIDVEDIEDPALSRLAERVRNSGQLHEAAHTFDTFFMKRLDNSDIADARARRLLAEVDGRGTSLGNLASRSGLSTRHVRRLFVEEIGVGPSVCTRVVRVRTATALLENTHARLADVAQHAGYYDQAHFTREFRTLIGVTPGRYRQQEQKIAPLFQDGRSVQETG